MTAARDRAGDDAEQAHRGEQQRAEREAGDQHRADALLAKRVADDVVHRAHVREREPRIDAPDRGPDFRDQRVRVAAVRTHEGQRAVAPVLGANEELRPAVLMHVVEPRLLDDADDGERLFVAERNLRAERAAAGKELSREMRSISASRTPSRRARSNARPATTRMPMTST